MEKYDNLGMVGEGSYGMVMKCKHKETGQIVAIKKFLESEDDKMVKKIAMREVRMLRKLRHENLVNLIEVFRRRKRLYLVFEFVDHTVLDDLEKYPNGLNEMTVRKILWQVLRGVEFCHSHNIIHRDIKPENILNSRSGVIKICDFGFARTLAAHGEIYTDYVATRWYRAPELLVGDTKYGRAVDIWAIGCLIGEMMTGDPIFPGKSDIDQLHRVTRYLGNLSPRHREIFQRNPLFAGMRLPEVKEVDPLEKRFPRFSSEVIDLMKQCLHLDPNDRPSSSSLLRHDFFKKDSFEEKVIPEIRARIQKEHQTSLLHRKNMQEKQQQQQQELDKRRKKSKESNTPKEASLPTPPNTTNRQQQNITTKESPRQPSENKNIPASKNATKDGSPKKDSLAVLKPQQNAAKTPPTDELKRKKEAEKDRKLPATIKPDHSIVTGPVQKQTSPQKQQTSSTKEDFSSPRTLIPKMTNEMKAKDASKLPQEVSKSPKNSTPQTFESSPTKTPEELKRVSVSRDVEILPKAAKKDKTPPPQPSNKEPKQSILKNPSNVGQRASKESISFEEPTSRGSEMGGEKRGNIKPDDDYSIGASFSNISLTQTASDTVISKGPKGGKMEKQSVSTPSSSLAPQKSRKSPEDLKKSPKEGKSYLGAGISDKKETLSQKLGGYHIPPIQSQGTPTKSTKASQDVSGSSPDASKLFPTQGIKVLDKTKKVSTNKESSSPQTSFEKSMYGSTASNFESMMMSMSGATSISHPAIKKSSTITGNQTMGGPSNASPYTQSHPYNLQQFGHHYSQGRDDKPGGSNLPLWSSTAATYPYKQLANSPYKNTTQESRISDVDKKPHRTTDDKQHHRHHHKHEERTDERTKHHSKTHEDKQMSHGRDPKRTRLPDLMGRGMGVGMSTSKEDHFPGLKPTGVDYQKRKSKTQKPMLMTIPNLDSTIASKQQQLNSTQADTFNDFPSVRRKNN